MSSSLNYYNSPAAVIDLPEASRASFIRRTYAHLAGALLVFAAIDALLLSTPIAEKMASMFFTGRGWAWLALLGVFMLISTFAVSWASSAVSRKTQYLGLGVYVVAESIIFAPLLYVATRIDPKILPQAALITIGLFLGLTWIAFTTKKDFSFLQGILKVGLWVALGLIVASVIFGFSLGIWFSGAMIALMAASVLYQTSNVIHKFQTNQEVVAALTLFASFATMLWYVIRILIELAANRD